MSSLMPPHIELRGNGLHIGIVVARYNWHITGATLDLVQSELLRLGVSPQDINILTVPGTYELATISKIMLTHNHYDALICIGCVMKGATRHDILVGDAAAQGIQHVALTTGVPIVFGVMCAETQQQAEERIQRGKEYAQTAIEMACTIHILSQKSLTTP